MKEIIYTTVFVILGLILLILFAFMFFPKSDSASEDVSYTPGVYTSSFSINNTDLELEVSVDSTHINGIRFTNLSESVATMYPLMQPTIESLTEQICKSQSLDEIEYFDENAYTSQIILKAIEEALKKARN